VDGLRRQLDRLQAKVSRASQAQPWPVLKHGSFEQLDAEPASASAWPIDPRVKDLVSIEAIEDAKSGGKCLTLRCTESPAFIRSHEIPRPTTGRLSVTAWIRTADDNRAPPLNISIDAYHRDQPYYRYAPVGQLQQKSADESNWQRIAVHFEDVPTSDLTNLRIGFDLMGPGHVQIDDVQIYDRWFDEQDAAALTQQFALASYHLKNKGDLKGCREVLEQYWARFFYEYFPDKKPSKTKQEPVPKEARLRQSSSNPSQLLDQLKSAPQRIFQRR